MIAPRSKRAAAKTEQTQLSVVNSYVSEAGEVNETRLPFLMRSTVLALAAMLVSFFLLTSIFQIDRVVTSTFGQIVTTEPTVVVQPLDPSIIKTIDVREGQRVTKGQLLSSLDPTFAAADVAALESQISGLTAQIARCEAELAGQPFTYIPDPGLRDGQKYADLQRAYFEQRKGQFESQIHAYDEQIAQAKAAIERLRNDQARFSERQKLDAHLESILSKLVSQQLESEVTLLQATNDKTEMQRNVEQDQNTLIETQHQLQATAASREAFIQQWHGQTSQELVGARQNFDQAKQQLEKADKHKDLVLLEAPDDAIVLRISKLSVGSVLQPGEPFMELALTRSPMEAEVYIDPRDIGFIRAGDSTTIKFDAYQYVEHGFAEGKVNWISPGTFIVPSDGTGGSVYPGGTSAQGAAPSSSSSDSQSAQLSPPFYKAHVSVTKLDLRNVPDDFQLLPGMTLTTDVHVGTRSLFWYLARGIVRGFDEAMREP
jgi:hemolysin D